MTTKLKVTEQDIEDWAKKARYPAGHSVEVQDFVRKQIARKKLDAAIRELPGSRVKEILLFMVDERLV